MKTDTWASLIAVYDLVAGRVAAEDDRLLFLADADPLHGPQIVVVERGGLDSDGGPAGGHRRLGACPQLQSAEQLITGDAGGGVSPHRFHHRRHP